jgi:hypothetical protein
VELKPVYAKQVTPRVATGSSDSDDDPKEEMRKTRAEEDLHHQTAPCRSSYTAHMEMLEKYSSSDFPTSEAQDEGTRTRRSKAD